MLKKYLLSFTSQKLYTITRENCCPFEFDIFLSQCLAEGYTRKKSKCSECWQGVSEVKKKNIKKNIRSLTEANLLEIYCVKYFEEIDNCDDDCKNCWKSFLKQEVKCQKCSKEQYLKT